MNMEFVTGAFVSISKAIPVTLALTVSSFLLALVLAIAITVVDYFRVPVLRQICAVYVSFFPGRP